MMKKLVLACLSVFTFFSFYGQENLSETEAKKFATMFNNAGGTYQFQIIDTREKLTIPISYIQTIEEARDENEIVYILFKENVRVMILPKNMIASGNYEALGKFEYLNSSDLK